MIGLSYAQICSYAGLSEGQAAKLKERWEAELPAAVSHDDSALWHAVYAAAWVSEFRESQRPGDPESFSDALKIDHSDAARHMADAAVAQLRKRCT